ncbi:hypothetical protein [Cupriavidus basilensis]
MRQMWRDAENFCEFVRTIPANGDVDKLYDFYGDREKLPKCFSAEDQVKNLFIAAMTWVYFHEIGHLMQEHGYIRARYGSGNAQGANEVHDCESNAENQLTGTAAVVSHVTELAADFEATNFYLMELIRHIINPDFVAEEKKGEISCGLVYLMLCGLSIVFFRFNGSMPLVPSAVPQGSHPNPMIRLEINIPHVFEILDIKGIRELTGHGLDRKQLVLLCGKAVFTATLYWSMTKTAEKKFDNRFMVRGLLTNPVVLEYLVPIVKCWDEILPEIKKIRRFGSPLGLLTFTDEFRERITKKEIWGEGPESRKS